MITRYISLKPPQMSHKPHIWIPYNIHIKELALLLHPFVDMTFGFSSPGIILAPICKNYNYVTFITNIVCRNRQAMKRLIYPVQIRQWMLDFTAENSDLVQMEQVGTTYEGRDIQKIKVSVYSSEVIFVVHIL